MEQLSQDLIARAKEAVKEPPPRHENDTISEDSLSIGRRVDIPPDIRKAKVEQVMHLLEREYVLASIFSSRTSPLQKHTRDLAKLPSQICPRRSRAIKTRATEPAKLLIHRVSQAKLRQQIADLILKTSSSEQPGNKKNPKRTVRRLLRARQTLSQD